MTFPIWLGQQGLSLNPSPHASNVGYTFDGPLPCGCSGPDRVRCYCETRHLEARQEWLRRKGDLFTDLGPEPIAAKWCCTCTKPENRPGTRHIVRHIVVHPDGKVFHWSCGKQIGQITGVTQPACVGG